MTQPDLLVLLKQKCDESTQIAVARKLKYSPSAINQAIKGTYKGDLTNLLTRVEEVYGSTKVACPLQGEITLGKCAANRALPFITVNPARVELWATCRDCEEKS
jgi:hypothetical protein